MRDEKKTRRGDVSEEGAGRGHGSGRKRGRAADVAQEQQGVKPGVAEERQPEVGAEPEERQLQEVDV